MFNSTKAVYEKVDYKTSVVTINSLSDPCRLL